MRVVPFFPFISHNMSVAKQDYYETLGVSKNANDVEIKKAYRKQGNKQIHAK